MNAVLGEGALLAEALDHPDFAALPPAERARAQRLALTVLRVLEPADKVLHPLMRKAPPLPVWNILRLAVVELAEGAAKRVLPAEIRLSIRQVAMDRNEDVAEPV